MRVGAQCALTAHVLDGVPLCSMHMHRMAGRCYVPWRAFCRFMLLPVQYNIYAHTQAIETCLHRHAKDVE